MDLKKFLGKRNNRIMLVILIIGVMIIAVSGSIAPKKNAQTDTVTADIKGEEERLSAVLSQIEGAGRVSVMISYAATAEKELAGEAEGRPFTSGGNVVVKRETSPAVRGVIVIADGAGDSRVRQKLAEAVTAVTGAGANHVCVYPRDN